MDQIPHLVAAFVAGFVTSRLFTQSKYDRLELRVDDHLARISRLETNFVQTLTDHEERLNRLANLDAGSITS